MPVRQQATRKQFGADEVTGEFSQNLGGFESTVPTG